MALTAAPVAPLRRLCRSAYSIVVPRQAVWEHPQDPRGAAPFIFGGRPGKRAEPSQLFVGELRAQPGPRSSRGRPASRAASTERAKAAGSRRTTAQPGSPARTRGTSPTATETTGVWQASDSRTRHRRTLPIRGQQGDVDSIHDERDTGRASTPRGTLPLSPGRRGRLFERCFEKVGSLDFHEWTAREESVARIHLPAESTPGFIAVDRLKQSDIDAGRDYRGVWREPHRPPPC